MLFSSSPSVFDVFKQRKLLLFIARQLPPPHPFSERILQTEHLKSAEEQELAHRNLYLAIEGELVRQAPNKWPSPHAVRFFLRKKFRLEAAAPGSFVLIFFSGERAAFVLLEELVKRLSTQLAWTPEKLVAAARKIVDPESFLAKMKAEELRVSWKAAERVFFSAPHVEPLHELEKEFGKLVRLLYHDAVTRFGKERANMLAEEIFRSLKKDYGAVAALSVLLGVIPEGVLVEERFEFYPKEQLEVELRARLREAQQTNIRLAEETQKTKQALERLEAARLDMERMQKVQGEFIQVVSHQFRTPLSVIRWQSELLTDMVPQDEANARTHEAIDAVHAKSIFLIDVLNDVFELLAIESGQFRLNLKPTPLWEMVEEMHKTYRGDAKNRSITVVFDKTSLPTEETQLDQGRIRSVLNTLMRNALQFTPAGGEVTLSLAKEMEGTREVFHFSIRDSGLGIEPENLEKVFGRFYRSAEAIKTVPDGAGLGLFIARYIIEAHKGKMWAESAGPGKGSTLHVTLPKT